MNIRLFGICIIALISNTSLALDFFIASEPPKQFSNQSCQSYGLSVGIASLNLPGLPISSNNDLSTLEKEIRKSIEFDKEEECKASSDPVVCKKQWLSSIKHWKKAVETITNKQATVTNTSFTSNVLLFEFLYKNLKNNKKLNLPPGLQIAINPNSRVFLVSVSSLSGNTYSSGHIVSLFGVDAPNASTNNAPELLFINSYDQNQCYLPGKRDWLGSVSWSSQYALKYPALYEVVRK